VWLSLEYFKWSYRSVVVAAAVAALLASVTLAAMNAHKANGAPARRKMVYRREYSRFYVLNILYGARKQVFLTFGPWVMIKVLGQPRLGKQSFMILSE
jgi:hypothetical protein